MNIYRPSPVDDDWDAIRQELERAFSMSRAAARSEESFVYVVHHDALLGRRGAGNAMVAAGLLSAARTAAIEGSRKGWTANVVAFDDGSDPDQINAWAQKMLDSEGVNGELIRLGASHLGKALP